MIGNVVEEVLRERAEEGNQETTLEVVPDDIEVVVEEREVRAFYSNKGKRLPRSISLKRGMWKREASNSSYCHLRRKQNE